jgi:Raf kinase inhibitor-like YbhB/YbcL family protein
MDTSVFAGIAVVVLQVSSPSFSNNDFIPSKFSCEGDNTSPAISVKNIPAQTQSLAIIVEDPDAPNGTVTHWIAWDMDPSGNITEKSTTGTQGKNTRGNNGYMGPCPPNGTHHYHFKIYALDKKLGLAEGSTKEQLLDAMKDHILGSGELIGLYKKAK